MARHGRTTRRLEPEDAPADDPGVRAGLPAISACPTIRTSTARSRRAQASIRRRPATRGAARRPLRYLRPIKDRKNLHRPDRLPGDPHRDRRRPRDGRANTARPNTRRPRTAEREVLVTAGAIGSPKLMMLSGIGPADASEVAGHRGVHDLPGVGANLTRPLWHRHRLRAHRSIQPRQIQTSRIGCCWAGLQYMIFKTGPVTSNVVEGGAFWYSRRRSAPIPICSSIFWPAPASRQACRRSRPARGLTLNSYMLRPKSRGRCAFGSADPADAAARRSELPGGARVMSGLSVEGVKISREIMHQPAFSHM